MLTKELSWTSPDGLGYGLGPAIGRPVGVHAHEKVRSQLTCRAGQIENTRSLDRPRVHNVAVARATRSKSAGTPCMDRDYANHRSLP